MTTTQSLRSKKSLERVVDVADFDKTFGTPPSSSVPARAGAALEGEDRMVVSSETIGKKGSTIVTDEGTIRIQPYRPSGSKSLKALISFTPRSSHFDLGNASSQTDPFRGFYTLFWIGLFLVGLKTVIKSFQDTGYPLSGNFYRLISGDGLVLALSDGVLVGASYLCVPFVKAIERGWFRYHWTGVVLQHIGQTAYLAVAVLWTFHRNWYWVQSGFLVLHSLSMLMKIHSYIAHNGQLSTIRRRLRDESTELDRTLTTYPGGESAALAEAAPFQLAHVEEQVRKTAIALAAEAQDEATTISGTPQAAAQLNRASSYDGSSPVSSIALRQRLVAAAAPFTPPHPATTTSASTPSTSGSPPSEGAHPSHPSTLEVHPLTFHPNTRIAGLARNIDAMREDLTSSGVKRIVWPANVTFWNFSDYLLCPTLVYELEYPRVGKMRPLYVLERTLATMGTFTLIYTVTEHYIINQLPKEGDSLVVSFINLALPMVINYILVFFIIFECICNGFAELTCFADREFYQDWWNSTTWDQFARRWNKPVHVFLLRHVYTSTLQTGKVSRTSATFLTFLLSALCHELVMAVVSKKFRAYLFIMQMAQLPLIALGRIPIVRRNKALGNVVFWLGLMSGFPLLCIAYLMY